MAETEQANSTVKEIEVDGYKFMVDTDLLDDVETFELIDRIENKNQIAAIVPLLEFIIGPEAYQQMKSHFAKADAAAHLIKLVTKAFPPKQTTASVLSYC